jgi:hypothetical protein
MGSKSRGRVPGQGDSGSFSSPDSGSGPREKQRGSEQLQKVSMQVSTSVAPDAKSSSGNWPDWARRLVTIGLLFHIAAVVAGAVGVPPSSELERGVADLFTPYHDLVDQGYAYRFYAEPPPTPVITATLQFGEGRPEKTIRLPGRSVSGPRMRHQRQLALANALFADVQEAKRQARDGSLSRLARAYARHLCKTHPGCQTVTLHTQQHLLPDPQRVRAELTAPGHGRFDLFDESLFTTPEWIGDFACDGF